MDKQTKLLLGLALVATGGYLLWQQTQNKKSFASVGKRRLLQMTGGVESDKKLLGTGGTFASMVGNVGDRSLLSMSGGVQGDRELLSMSGGVQGDRELLSYTGPDPVGRRMRMSGGSINVQQSTFNASGAPYAGTGGGFFKVEDSGWQGFAGDKTFFQVGDSGWQG